MNKKILPKELRLGPHIKDLYKCLMPISRFYYYEPFQVIIITLLNYISTVILQFSNSVLCRQMCLCCFVGKCFCRNKTASSLLSVLLRSQLRGSRTSVRDLGWILLPPGLLPSPHPDGWMSFLSPALFGSVRLLCSHFCWKID